MNKLFTTTLTHVRTSHSKICVYAKCTTCNLVYQSPNKISNLGPIFKLD
ncbi:hypothetical protein KSS87_023621 [Heliosperma pusillum]|nr:hypothetical protein KSS87_023621 [Heliosperma pusillum]